MTRTDPPLDAQGPDRRAQTRERSPTRRTGKQNEVWIVVAWHTIGPRQDLLDTMWLTLLVGLAVFVANGGYALIRFGNPRRIENRRGWAVGIAAGLPFFPLVFAALSVADRTSRWS